MTLVGKIFAFAITVLAVIFLALSVVVFSTATNWKKKSDEAQGRIAKLTGEVSAVKEQIARANTDYQNAKKDAETEKAVLEQEISKLKNSTTEFQTQATQARTQLEQQTQNAKNSLAEAEAMRSETEKLRETLANVQSLTNRYKEAELELQDQVVELTRDLKVMKNNNEDLRKRAALVTSLNQELNLLSTEMSRPGAASPALSKRTTQVAKLIQQGLVSEALPVVPPPSVLKGEITRVDARNRYVELSVGSDDGLVVGHELYISRTSPSPEYVGQLVIKSVDEDTSLGEIISLYNQRKPQEGDIVKPKK